MSTNLDKTRRVHPRPQFIRDNWLSLDGDWQFYFDDQDQGISEGWYKGLPQHQIIRVPFTYETKLSGIEDEKHHPVVWYQKEFTVEKQAPASVIFEGVDYDCQVWLNDELIGSHKGGYSRFELKLSNLKLGNNQLILRVTDSMDCEQPRGKQRWKKDNFGCWYVQTTGILKSVWLQYYKSEFSLKDVKITPDTDRHKVIFEPIFSSKIKEGILEIELSIDGQMINHYKGSFFHQMTPIELDTRVQDDSSWGTREWHPNHPNLYDVKFKLFDLDGKLLDETISYFGMRKIAIENGQILLNNRLLYQRLILDQGYWAESGITPPSVAAMELDIDRVKELGYNGLRKYQKIEDERFLYLCDKKGMLVWSEMPSTFIFNDIAVKNFTDEWQEIVSQYYNHPSIITWVPFNESWGISDVQHNKKQQRFTESIYYLTKSIDEMRPVITNDGWEHTISDIITLHDYEELGQILAERYQVKDRLVTEKQLFNRDHYIMADGYEYRNQPILISEFGGIAFSTSNKEQWGYGRMVEDEDQFLKRFETIHEAIQKAPYITGFCYTQLTDVEQEVNGLLDPNREFKVDKETIREINQRRLF